MEVLLCQDKDLLQGQLSLLVPGNCFHHLVILNICKTFTGVPRAWGTAAPWATPAHPEPLSRDMGWVSDCLVWGEEAQPHRQTPQNALIPPPTSSALLEHYSSSSSRILPPFFKETPPILHGEQMQFQSCIAGTRVFSLEEASLDLLLQKRVSNPSKGVDNFQMLVEDSAGCTLTPPHLWSW